MALMCRVYGVSRSGYYAWCRRPLGRRAEENRELLKDIERVHRASRGIYGSPRVNEALRRAGVVVSKHRVARLMRERGLRGRVVRVTRRQPGLHCFCEGVANHLRSVAAATGPDQQWAGDITYLKLGKRWLYLAVVLDLYSRKVVGWALSDRRTVTLTWRALGAALRRRCPQPGLVFHTDRGIEYRGLEFRALLNRYWVIPSMNRPGQCTDNATMESFFHTLKAELIRKNRFDSVAELRRKLAGYINHFYNPMRLHSALGYRSPVEYEHQAV